MVESPSKLADDESVINQQERYGRKSTSRLYGFPVVYQPRGKRRRITNRRVKGKTKGYQPVKCTVWLLIICCRGTRLVKTKRKEIVGQKTSTRKTKLGGSKM
jgi:hypothetical protein